MAGYTKADTDSRASKCSEHASGASALDPLDLLGVSVHWLSSGLKEEAQRLLLTDDGCCNERSTAAVTIHDLEPLNGPSSDGIARRNSWNVMSPVDGKLGASYAQCLWLDDDKTQEQIKENVGPATHMLSYTWSYHYEDIVDALVDYCHANCLDLKRTYIWIDFLCINQHRVIEAKQNGGTGLMNFEERFPQQLKSIGHMLAMMTPWNKPMYLTRIWCIYEFYTAHTLTSSSETSVNGGSCCEITVILPPKDKLELQRDLFKWEKLLPGDQMFYILSKTKIQEAQSTFQSDRDMILSMIENSVGYTALNNKVNEFIRSWIRDAIKGIVEEKLEKDNAGVDGVGDANDETCLGAVDLMYQVGQHFQESYEFDESLKWFRKGLSTCKQKYGSNHEKIANCYDGIGQVQRRKGEYVAALDALNSALSIRTSLLGEHHIETAASYNNVGLVLGKLGRYNESLTAHRKALEIRKMSGFLVYVAQSLTNIGLVLELKGDYYGAMKELHQALSICTSRFGEMHLTSSFCYKNMGTVLMNQGDYDGALHYHRKSLAIYQSGFDSNHPMLATAYYNIGLVLEKQGNREDALIQQRKSHGIRKTLLGRDHPDTVDCQNAIDRLSPSTDIN